jgi:hypothetical protein
MIGAGAGCYTHSFPGRIQGVVCLTNELQAKQHLCDCRPPGAGAYLLSMSGAGTQIRIALWIRCPRFYSLSLSLAPLSGVRAQPALFRPHHLSAALHLGA